jgi:hypothetical protein
MDAPTADRIGPTIPEQARSAVAAAASLTLTAGAHHHVLFGLHSLEDQGQVVLHLPVDTRLGADLAHAPAQGLRTVAEFTDLAPISVRDRVRARVKITGALTLAPTTEPTAGPTAGSTAEPTAGSTAEPTAGSTAGPAQPITARLTPERITFDEASVDGSGSVIVSPDAFATAETDPLAAHEADLLLHLADAHADLVAQLTRLVEPRHLHHVVRVQPLAMDRLGLTLRLEYARHHTDVRLPFSVRLTDVAQVGVQFRALLADAASCPHRRRPHARR